MQSLRLSLGFLVLLLAACTRANSAGSDAGRSQCKADCAQTDACASDACVATAAGRDASIAQDGAVHPGHGDAAADGGRSADHDAGQVADDAGTQPGTAGVDCTKQPTTFPSFDRSCQADSECVTVRRTINCCGSELATAVNQASVRAFEAAAASCDAQFPACGCAAAAPTADDGTRFDDAHPYAVSKCTAQVCSGSFVAAAKTSCGPNGLSCDARTEVCVSRQPVGPAIVYECKPVPAPCMWTRGCACLRSSLCTGGFNTCSDVGENSIDCLCPLCQ